MVEKKKRKTLPPRGDPKARVEPKPTVPDRLGAIERREDFGENTFAGALAAVKNVLEKASEEEAAVKGRKKS